MKHAKKGLLVVFGIVSAVTCGTYALDWVSTGAANRIHFSGTSSYDRATRGFPIGAEDAWKILLDHKEVLGRYMREEEHSLLFFVNGEYCLPDLHKFCSPLSGYYVNASTGRVTRRSSVKKICRGVPAASWRNMPSIISGIWFLPKDAYSDEAVVRSGAISRQAR